MKTLVIDNIEILNAYSELRHHPPRDEKRPEDLYPDIIKEILERDKVIMPKHVEHELFKRIFLRQCIAIESRFKIDQNCESAINSLCLYMRQDPQFLTLAEGYSLNKGILLLGRIGCGKTVIMRAMANTLSKFNDVDIISGHDYNLGFRVIESWKITADFSKEGYEIMDGSSMLNLNDELTLKSICIDDLGAEQVPTYYFQNSANVIGEILIRRYNHMKKNRSGNYFTHGTTNLDGKSLAKFYQERTYSRMVEMFNALVLPGGDRRY